MLHLFLDISPITHLVARGVIARERIPAERVVWVTASPSAPEVPLERASTWPDPGDSRSGFRLPSLLRPLQHLRDLDAWVDELTGGEPFHVYAPYTHKREHWLLIRHARCRGFSFLEEGLASYHTREEIDERVPPRPLKPWKRWLYRGRMREKRFFQEGNARAYGVSEDSFPGMEGRVVLQCVFRRDRGAEFDEVETVLATDGLSVRGDVRHESVLAGLDRALPALRELGVGRVHVKPHRVQLGTGQLEETLALLSSRGFKTEQLPLDTSLEELAFSAPRVRFVINLSSCGIYAAAAGCQVLSFARCVEREEPAFGRLIEGLPRAFRERIDFVEPDREPAR